MPQNKDYTHLKQLYNARFSVSDSAEDTDTYFDTIKHVIQHYFLDVFDLDVLEQSARQGGSPYLTLFMTCLEKLQDAYTEPELIVKLTEVLEQDQTVRTFIYTRYLFNHSSENDPSLLKHPGYCEKLASGQLSKGEPLTYFDMRRVGRTLAEQISLPGDARITVHHLKQLTEVVAANQCSLISFVNLNNIPGGMPKWAVVDRSMQTKIQIYCEADLLESEKKMLEQALPPKKFHYTGGGATHAISTGYMALAWVSDQYDQQKFLALTCSNDFLALVVEFSCLLFSHGEKLCLQANDNQYCTSSYILHISKQHYDVNGELSSTNAEAKNFIKLFVLTEASILGSLGSYSLDSNDLCRALQLSIEKKITHYSGTLNRRTMAADCRTPLLQSGMLKENLTTATLTIPEDEEKFKVWVLGESDHSGYGPYYMKRSGEKNTDPSLESAATSLVLTMFRLWSTKAQLHIELPERYTLNDSEQQLIENLSEFNPYIQNLSVNEQNASLSAVSKRLGPVLARNRWLAENDYRPPVGDQYWERAAHYWLMYLYKNVDHLRSNQLDTAFHECVGGMGTLGVQAVLQQLVTREHFFQRVYGDVTPTFYLAMCDSESSDALSLLDNHLRSGKYFPFSRIILDYQTDHDDSIMSLLTNLNCMVGCQRLTLNGVLKHGVPVIDALLDKMIATSSQQRWTTVIYIPELEDGAHIPKEAQQLQPKYNHLNNLLLKHRRQLQGNVLTEKYRDESQRHPAISEPHRQHTGQAIQTTGSTSSDLLEQQDIRSWPLNIIGPTRLQLQQQLQSQQQFQQEAVRKSHKRMPLLEERALLARLVTYSNIDQLLGAFWQHDERNEELALNLSLYQLTQETTLQCIFRLCVNAMISVDAKYVFHGITQDAMKVLIKSRHLLASGLDSDNLPQGFYTQRTQEDRLILCYEVDTVHEVSSNPLTLDLSVTLPRAEPWLGDSRQLQLQSTEPSGSAMDAISENDWFNISLFIALQPNTLTDNHKTLLSFCATYPVIAQSIFELHDINRLETNPITEGLEGFSQNMQKAYQYLPVFLQVFEAHGEAGLEAFFKRDTAKLHYSVSQLCSHLLRGESDHYTDCFNKRVNVSAHHLRGVGQIYYHYGAAGVHLFLKTLTVIESTLGEKFFSIFIERLLNVTDNFSYFMTDAFFATVQAMSEKFRPGERNCDNNLTAWQSILVCHMTTCRWDSIENLWNGYCYFLEELDKLGLSLEGDEFDSISSENMLVCMGRLLSDLQCIPTFELQQKFLRKYKETTTDRSHGGVHYALRYEGFHHFEPSLQLQQFRDGMPTYAPQLSNVYSWNKADTHIQIARCLASQPRFCSIYEALLATLYDAGANSKPILVCLLYTQYRTQDAVSYVDALGSLPQLECIAQHLHAAMTLRGNSNIAVELEAILSFLTHYNVDLSFLENFPDGSLLEVITIMHRVRGLSEPSIKENIALWQSSSFKLVNPHNLDSCHKILGLKLMALFGINEINQLSRFLEYTRDLKPIIQQELSYLASQLLSLNVVGSNLTALDAMAWNQLLNCIQGMKNNPRDASVLRHQFVGQLTQQGIKFKYSDRGNVRVITAADADTLELAFFRDHVTRLKHFITQHIVIDADEDVDVAFEPLFGLLKQLQLNQTAFNEIEALLGILEETKPNCYWHVSYLYKMLNTLHPTVSVNRALPCSILRAMLQEREVQARSINEVEKHFHLRLQESMQAITNNESCSREQQAALCQIALREYNWRAETACAKQLVQLINDHRDFDFSFLLKILVNIQNQSEFDKCFSVIVELLSYFELKDLSSREQTINLWMQAIFMPTSVVESARPLFKLMHQQMEQDSTRRALYLHIVAWSTLHVGLRNADEQQIGLSRKAQKLCRGLGALTTLELEQLAACYPGQPSPGANDILQMLKAKQAGTTFECSLNQFLCQPFPASRPDYAMVAATREADFQRMLETTQLRSDGAEQPIGVEHAMQITFLLTRLKSLEQGKIFIQDSDVALSMLTQQQLLHHFQQLALLISSKQGDDLLIVRTDLAAILFEAMLRTTRKYPNLAQQFSLIADFVCCADNSFVLRMATGEGKSHVIAMHAALHAARGRTVDVCTAKPTLADRDMQDYYALYRYLGLSATRITASSPRELYTEHNIHYSTLGELSLFLDGQNYYGTPVPIDRDNRVGLHDEIDFIRFEEGMSTEYNYARPIAHTPKQQAWFYRAINDFYLTHKNDIRESGNKVSASMLQELAEFLLQKADDIRERKQTVDALFADQPLSLVQWMRSAHEADCLKRGIHFTVQTQPVLIDGEMMSMQVIIPLSSDSQKMLGSTFSNGVHQLLATRLNDVALSTDKPQNIHVPQESHIISSQVAAVRMKELWGMSRGFTGSVSEEQANVLQQDQQMQVLSPATNQHDAREWLSPIFCDDDENRIDQLILEIQACLSQKQSFLFCCKDDTQVSDLSTILKEKLSSDDYAQVLFYTNESSQSSVDILNEKQKKEGSHGEKYGTGLIASGFGRGDNVGVDAVFLFDVNNENDLVQKGGRTARYGSTGRVMQFYVIPELVEKKNALELALAHAGIKTELYEKTLDALPGDDPHTKLLNQVMYLCNYLHCVTNHTNQVYRELIAHYSGWAMSLIARLPDSEKRHTQSLLLSTQLQYLEKAWLVILSDDMPNEGCHANIINKITDKLTEASKVFSASIDGEQKSSHDFLPHTLLRKEADLSSRQKITSTSEQRIHAEPRVASILCALLMKMMSPTELENRQLFQQVMKKVSIFSGDPELFGNLLQLVSGFTSLTKLYDSLQDVNDADKLVQCLSAHRDKPDWRAVRHRNIRAIVIGSDDTTAWLADQGVVIEHLTVIAELETRYLDKSPVSNKHPFKSLVGSALTYAPRHTMSMMKQCEYWLIGLKREGEPTSELLSDFSTVLAANIAAPQQVLFQLLTEKTQMWWNRAGGKYQKEIRKMWALLSGLEFHQGDFAHFAPLLQWALGCQGKEWFQILSVIAQSPCIQSIPAHSRQIIERWDRQNGNKKSEKITDLTRVSNALNTFYLHLPKQQLAEISEILVGLNLEGFDWVITQIDRNQTQLKEKPDLLAALVLCRKEGLPAISSKFYRLCVIARYYNQNSNDNCEFENFLELLIMKETSGCSPLKWLTICAHRCNQKNYLPFIQTLSQILVDINDSSVIDALDKLFDTMQPAGETAELLMLFHGMKSNQIQQCIMCFVNLVQVNPANATYILHQLQSNAHFTPDRLLALETTGKITNLLGHAQFEAELTAIVTFYELIDVSALDNALQDGFVTLNQLSFESMLNAITTNLAAFNAYDADNKVKLLQVLVNYLHTGVPLDKFKIMTKILFYSRHFIHNRGFDLERFITKWNEITGMTIAQLNLLDEIISALEEDNMPLIGPLFDKAVAYITVTAIDEESSKGVKDNLLLFYRELSDKHTNRRQMNEQPGIQDLFSYHVDTASKRIRLMRCLKEGDLVTTQADGTWTQEENDHLFSWGCDRYVEHMRSILPSTQMISHGGARQTLDRGQRVKLLALGQEMTDINGSRQQQCRRTPNAQQIERLYNSLRPLLRNYGSFFKFKSDTRRTQLANLNGRLDQLMQDNRQDRCCREVWKLLAEAKITAIQKDREVDNSRITWRKFNRKGHSRYLDTLSKMQDCVLVTWAQTSNELTDMAGCQQELTANFNNMLNLLVQRMQDYCNQKHYNDTHPRRAFLQTLRNKIQQQNIPDIIALLNRDTTKKLPGHIVTLVNECLYYGEAALNDYMTAQQPTAALRLST